MRALAGLTLGGVPAVAMAYLSEEMHAKAIGLAMGLYISGNSLGGMSGRLVTGAVTDFSSWRVAIMPSACWPCSQPLRSGTACRHRPTSRRTHYAGAKSRRPSSTTSHSPFNRQ